jgi:nickel-dependent lactate racemase
MVVGREASGGALSEQEIRSVCAEAIAELPLHDKRVLVLIPDHTRHAPIGLFFRILFDLIGGQVKALDYLIATGTHHPMSRDHILRHVGITEAEYRSTYAKVNFFNHEHDNPAALRTIGTISPEELHALSGGLLSQRVDITINKRIFDYDHIFIVSPVVPHETVGFSGGNKYFFPGIGGVDIIQTFHWIGAVITNLVVNGVKETPVRRIINHAAQLLPMQKFCFAFTVEKKKLACLYVGSPEEAWDKAADSSQKLHIAYRSKPVKRVLGIAPNIYDDIWVAGKVMYKHEPIIADGGEVIIYAPHIKEVSYTHGKEIEKVGYHVPEYFLKQWEKFRSYSGLILAHSTNVKGIGTYEDGIEQPRVTVTLATSIPEETCKRINLGYRDPRTINVDYWREKQDDDLLVVENAGQVLYRLAPAG